MSTAPDWDNIAAENTRRAVANLPESEIARFIAGCEMLTREAAEEWS